MFINCLNEITSYTQHMKLLKKQSRKGLTFKFKSYLHVAAHSWQEQLSGLSRQLFWFGGAVSSPASKFFTFSKTSGVGFIFTKVNNPKNWTWSPIKTILVRWSRQQGRVFLFCFCFVKFSYNHLFDLDSVFTHHSSSLNRKYSIIK